MVYTLRVSKSPEFTGRVPAPFFVKNFDNRADFQAVANLCDNKRRIGWPESALIPVRTDTWEHVRDDLFFPGLAIALKTKDLATRIFLSIVMTVWDILLFPARLVTVIPRAIYNTLHPKESHPFYQYLVREDVAAEHLSADHVYLEAEWTEQPGEEQPDAKGFPWELKMGEHWVIRPRAGNTNINGETFNFIHLPAGASATCQNLGVYDPLEPAAQ